MSHASTMAFLETHPRTHHNHELTEMKSISIYAYLRPLRLPHLPVLVCQTVVRFLSQIHLKRFC